MEVWKMWSMHFKQEHTHTRVGYRERDSEIEVYYTECERPNAQQTV